MSSEAQQVSSSVRRRLADLQTYQLPRLRDCKGPIDLQRDLSAELKDDIRKVKRSIDGLDALAYDQPTEREREEIMGLCRKLNQELDRIHREYRDALLESTRKIKTATAESYELLPETTTNDGAPTKAPPVAQVQGQDDALQTKTNEVTDALRRTAANMRAELERSVMATQLLDESTQTLRSTSGLYDTYSDLLTTSTRLVKQLEKADWYDKLIIFCALAFFFLVVGFIIKRRVLDKAVNGVGWWIGGSYKLITGQGRRRAAKQVVKNGKKVVQTASAVKESASTVRETLSALSKGAADAVGGATISDEVAVATATVTVTVDPTDGRIRNEL
ncbi:Protein transport protein sec20 [Naganishia albida]|nr:Protein transport protein sec20 [Naganishia albida]